MIDPKSIVIIGAGIAGTRAAEALRTAGFDGAVTLLNPEQVHPYDHVPLSKHYLLDEPGFHPVFLHDDDWYAAHRIDLRLDSEAVAIEPGQHSVTLASGEHLAYDRLLLATGAEPRHLRVPGAELDGVHYLRTLEDADRLKSTFGSAERIVVVGDGFIGCEVTASARAAGIAVTLVGRGPLPMQRALGPEMATFFRDIHAEHGVDLRANVEVTALEGSGRVRTVVLADGTELAADAMVAGIGAIPRTDLARAAGITVDNGIQTDAFLATDAPDVYAAGDVAAVWDPSARRHVRREHWASALHQGPTAAHNMLGEQVPYERTPFFFTDQYEVWMEYTGTASATDELVFRGDMSAGEKARFIAFWLREDRVVAGMNINIKGVPPAIRELITSQRRIDRAALVDPDVELAEL